MNEDNLKTLSGFTDTLKEIETQYVNIFKERHLNITPMSQDELKAKCQELHIDFSTLSFDHGSGLCQNACQSPLCPFFLKVQERFKIHLDSW